MQSKGFRQDAFQFVTRFPYFLFLVLKHKISEIRSTAKNILDLVQFSVKSQT